MLLLGVFISLFVAMYILRLLIRLWQRSKREQREIEQANILNNVQRQTRNEITVENRGLSVKKGMS